MTISLNVLNFRAHRIWISIINICKEDYSEKNEGGVTVLGPCTLSDEAL